MQDIYPSSYFIVVEINCPTDAFFLGFQNIDKAFRCVLTEPNVIPTSSPLPFSITTVLFVLFNAMTSGYFVLSALKRDLVCDGSVAYGM